MVSLSTRPLPGPKANASPRLKRPFKSRIVTSRVCRTTYFSDMFRPPVTCEDGRDYTRNCEVSGPARGKVQQSHAARVSGEVDSGGPKGRTAASGDDKLCAMMASAFQLSPMT